MFASITNAFNTAKTAVTNAASKVPNGVYIGLGVAAAAAVGIVAEKKFGVVSGAGNLASGLFSKTADVASAAADGVAQATAS